MCMCLFVCICGVWVVVEYIQLKPGSLTGLELCISTRYLCDDTYPGNNLTPFPFQQTQHFEFLTETKVLRGF